MFPLVVQLATYSHTTMSTPSSSENSLLFPATQPSANLNPELVLLSAFIFGKKPPDEPVYVTRLSPDTRIPDWEAISRQRMQLDFPLETSINVWKVNKLPEFALLRTDSAFSWTNSFLWKA